MTIYSGDEMGYEIELARRPSEARCDSSAPDTSNRNERYCNGALVGHLGSHGSFTDRVPTKADRQAVTHRVCLATAGANFIPALSCAQLLRGRAG